MTLGAMQSVQWVAGERTLQVTVAVFVLAVILSLWAWKRSGFAWSIALLETLRLLAIALVLLALNQPEWVETEPSDRLPKIAILWDDSVSMATEDVVAQGGAGGRLIPRERWLLEHLDLDALRLALADRFEVIASPLSGAEGEPQGGSHAQETDLAGPMDRMLDQQGLRALVLWSDGDWNAGGDPAEVAMKYRMRGVPIFTTAVGSGEPLPDVEVLPLEPPTFSVVGKTLAVPYALKSSMNRDLRFDVTLTDSEGASIVEEVLLEAQTTLEGTLDWTPSSLGTYTLTLEVPVESGELDETNNTASAEVEVREESLRVLLVESYPRWEYRYMRNAMVRDPGVEVSCLLFHPDIPEVGGGPHYLDGFPTRADLLEYDVIFLGDVGVGADQLTLSQCEMIKGVVAEQAAGLILMPGLGGRQHSLLDSELLALFPVDLDPAEIHGRGSAQASRLVLTEEGRASQLTRLAADEGDNADLWATLPGFQWHAGVARMRPGSRVLAVHSDAMGDGGRVPLLATKTYGTGKVLFMGTDGAWRWREGAEDRYHYRFWRQVVRWMAYQRKMNAGESLRLFHTPERPEVGGQVALFSNVMDVTGEPLNGATVLATIQSPSGQVLRARFEAQDGEWGLYRSFFRPEEPGEYQITLSCPETKAQIQASLAVSGELAERVGQPARHDILEELAQISRGKEIPMSKVGEIAASLNILENPPLVARRTRLWSHPALGALVLVLLGCFWIGRKMVGRF